MQVELIPQSLERDHLGNLVIAWSDGRRLFYSAERLRKVCPCATCREKRAAPNASSEPARKSLPVLSLAEAKPIRIERMQPIGNYAYGIAFSDGHDSGIFTFELLIECGERQTAQSK